MGCVGDSRPCNGIQRLGRDFLKQRNMILCVKQDDTVATTRFDRTAKR